MTEPDNDFFAGDAFAYVGFGFVGVAVAFLDVVGNFVRAAVFRAFERADGACRPLPGSNRAPLL